jgi:site-specific DNA recombinase
MAPELVEQSLRAYHAEVNRLRVDRERQGSERELERVVRRLDGLIEAIADGLRTPGMKSKLEELEARKETLQAALAAAPAPLPLLHPDLAELYRRKVGELHEALADPVTRDEALTNIRNLVDRVVLHPVEGGFEIELVGRACQWKAHAEKYGRP